MMEDSVWSAIGECVLIHVGLVWTRIHVSCSPDHVEERISMRIPFNNALKKCSPMFLSWPSSLCQVNWSWSATVIHQEIWHHFSDFYVRTVLLKAGIVHSLELSGTIHCQVFGLVPISYVNQCEAPWVWHALAQAAWINHGIWCFLSFLWGW